MWEVILHEFLSFCYPVYFVKCETARGSRIKLTIRSAPIFPQMYLNTRLGTEMELATEYPWKLETRKKFLQIARLIACARSIARFFPISTASWKSFLGFLSFTMLSTLRPVARQANRQNYIRAVAARCASTWANVPQGPPDAILGITEAFKANSFKEKINLGVGAYRERPL